MSEFVAAHRHHGVEPICRVLSTEEHQIAPSSVRSALARPRCARRLADDELKVLIAEIFVDNYEVYGARKIKAALKRGHGLIVDRARVTRLMCELDIRGAARTRSVRTTRPDKSSPRAPDLVKRQFTAECPNELWVSDFTYVSTWQGWLYAAFVIDVFARRIIGWRVARSMRSVSTSQSGWRSSRAMTTMVDRSRGSLSMRSANASASRTTGSSDAGMTTTVSRDPASVTGHSSRRPAARRPPRRGYSRHGR